MWGIPENFFLAVVFLACMAVFASVLRKAVRDGQFEVEDGPPLLRDKKPIGFWMVAAFFAVLAVGSLIGAAAIMLGV